MKDGQWKKRNFLRNMLWKRQEAKRPCWSTSKNKKNEYVLSSLLRFLDLEILCLNIHSFCVIDSKNKEHQNDVLFYNVFSSKYLI